MSKINNVLFNEINFIKGSQMAKRWTAKEDDFLVAYYGAIGSSIGPRDLNRSTASVNARVKKLKENGAWEAYKTAYHHRTRALLLAGHVDPEFVELDTQIGQVI